MPGHNEPHAICAAVGNVNAVYFNIYVLISAAVRNGKPAQPNPRSVPPLEMVLGYILIIIIIHQFLISTVCVASIGRKGPDAVRSSPCSTNYKIGGTCRQEGRPINTLTQIARMHQHIINTASLS